ncbi:MAG: YetF domain-containing protein [Acidimicrobiia bacterium]
MELVVRASVIYWFLWLVVRGTGKRSLAELSPLDLVLVVVLGDLVQQGVTQEDMSMTGAIIAISVFVGWTLLADGLSHRYPRARRILTGEPVVVLRAGIPLERQLAREGLSLDDLNEAARMEGYGTLQDIEVAILETDGRISFIGRQH